MVHVKCSMLKHNLTTLYDGRNGYIMTPVIQAFVLKVKTWDFNVNGQRILTINTVPKTFY